MTLVDIIFHHGGDWIRKSHILYSKKLVHSWEGYDSDLISFIDLVNEYTGELMYIGVQQLIVNGSSSNYYEVVDDSGIRQLLSLISDEFKCLNFYAVDKCELSVNVPNIVHYFDSHPSLTEVGTDCSEVECESESDNDSEGDEVGYDSKELQTIAYQKNREIDVGLQNYKELYKGMSFKDIPEARKCINLYSLANKKDLKQEKSDKERLRYKCVPGCPFVVLIFGDGNLPGVRIKTLNPEHACGEVFDNSRVDYHTIALYFKKKLQDNPMYKIKEMRADIKNVFNTNVSYGKCKRAKREILEKLEGSFIDGYNKLEAYANELRESNPGSDVIINLSKDALAPSVRRFLRMYICFHTLKMGFKEGLRPFIGLDGTFLKGKAKGQLLIVVGLDYNNQTYHLAWAIVDKETKRTWNWFLELLQRSLDLKEGKGITFMSDMQKGLIQAVHTVFPESNHRYCVKHIEANWCKK
uniref:Uncharacterized protein LOC104210973 n=1 Tax=Nicotiana sylvestris TaxID=4096 RepID=A0A1U7V7P6_NICSY|nr:PREDICTED: uncharacterized protein LOC104210973 [Nicotiana sylvestris]